MNEALAEYIDHLFERDVRNAQGRYSDRGDWIEYDLTRDKTRRRQFDEAMLKRTDWLLARERLLEQGGNNG